MTPDELRALADALEPMAGAPRFEDCDVPGFCAWVRACADAKPVGYVTANGLRSLRQDDATVLLYAHDYLIRPDHVALYTRPAPAAPQAEPKREPTGAPYGIIDPDYGRVYTIARKLAWEEGYAIGLHGSFTRDLDLIAVPWAERACEAEHLIRRIADATGLKLRDGVGVKPHGRRAWTLLFPAFGDPRFVDLSVMPRIGGSDAGTD